MSRTYRRKNIEDTYGGSWARKGRKSGGFYSTYDNEFVKVRYTSRKTYEEDGWTFVECKTVWTWKHSCPIYRPMTERERNDRYRQLHGESRNANEWSPGKWYRKNREAEHRSKSKQEIIRWMKNPEEYEPIISDDPRSHWWDWS